MSSRKYKILKQPKKMKYSEENKIYYQQINWSKVKIHDDYKISILKGDIPYHKSYLIINLNEYLLFDLIHIIIEYLYVELNFTFVQYLTGAGPICDGFYNVNIIIDSAIIELVYEVDNGPIKLLVIYTKINKCITTYTDITNIEDENTKNIIMDCVYICDDHLRYLSQKNKLDFNHDLKYHVQNT